MTDLNINSWPFQEAERILKLINYKTPAKGFVLFETGYGPSGLPHIGTFGEVARTSMIIKAFNILAPEIPTKLICFSDDMDGLRKVPSNLPNQEILQNSLGLPLTIVPDPYGTEASFGANMNKRLVAFLNKFNFEFEFASSSEYYKSGRFNKTLEKMLKHYNQINDLIRNTLGAERREEYSIFMPICPTSGKVLEKGVISVNPEKNTIKFYDSEDKVQECYVGDGNCKLQWKADFGMRWAALEVNYEMYGKDLISSADIASKLCKIIGAKAPVNFHYELFLDDAGQKISKSKGNGLTMDEWLRYAPHESLSYYMYLKPKSAKRLFFDVIPKATDEYLTFLNKYNSLDNLEDKYKSPIFYIFGNKAPDNNTGNISFSLLLNLASACNPESNEILWGFIAKYDANLNKENAPLLDNLTQYAINYYQDFIRPYKEYRSASEIELTAIKDLKDELQKIPENSNSSEIQTLVYDIGKKYEFDLKEWFGALYQILLGQKQGPRMGSFIEIFGIDNMIKLIEEKIS